MSDSMSPSANGRPLAIVTGASSGIGYHLAKCCAENGYDLVLAADQPLDDAALDCRSLGARVETLQTELASRQGVDELVAAVGSRPIGALLANAGHGLGHGFLDRTSATSSTSSTPTSRERSTCCTYWDSACAPRAAAAFW